LSGRATGDGEGLTPPFCGPVVWAQNTPSFTFYHGNLLGDIQLTRGSFVDTSYSYSGSSSITISPVSAALALQAAPTHVFQGGAVTATGSTNPSSVADNTGTDTIPVEGQIWSYANVSGFQCNSGSTQMACIFNPPKSGTIQLTAFVNGGSQSKTASVTVHCLPDSSDERYRDSLMRSSMTLRRALDSLDQLRSTRMEHLVNIYHDGGSGKDTALYVSDSATGATSCTVGVVNPTVPQGWVLIGRAHDHPDSVPPNTCPNAPSGGYGSGDPSWPADQSQPGVDYGISSTVVPTFGVTAGGVFETNYDPSRGALNWTNTYKRNGNDSCVFP
jgi:hypothetical protein